MGKQCLVEIQNLKKYFPVGKGSVLHAVDDVSLCIEKGQTLGVVGESGCGKSTLGRTILRLEEPTSGKIYFDGNEITSLKKRELRELRTKMQIVFQDPFSSLDPRMTIEDSIAEPIVVNKMIRSSSEIYSRVDCLMEMVGLASRNAQLFPHEISGGLRQRAGIARALATNPKFIVCDEPVSALDVSIQAQILNLLMDLQEEMKLSYMFITHDLSVVKHISHKIAVMYLGQCVEYADTQELFKNPVHPYTRALLESIPTPTVEARHKQIHIIKGEIASPIDPAPGCRFASRCPYASEECCHEQRQIEVSKGHFVACCKAIK